MFGITCFALCSVWGGLLFLKVEQLMIKGKIKINKKVFILKIV